MSERQAIAGEVMCATLFDLISRCIEGRYKPMKTCVSVTFFALFLLLQSVAARAQSNFVDVGSNSVEPVTATVTSPRPYRELSIYTGGMLANPQLMSDLKNQRLFFTGVRLTSRLFTTRHLFIGGNLDVKPLVIHSRSVPNGRQYTYGGGSSVGLQFAPRVAWRWQPFFDVDGDSWRSHMMCRRRTPGA